MNAGYRIRQIILLCGDGLSFLVGLWVALALRSFQVPTSEIFAAHLPLFLIVFGLWMTVNYINGLYDLVRVRNDWRSFRRLSETGLIALLVGIIFFYLLPNGLITPKTILLITAVVGYAISALWRSLYNVGVGGGQTLQTSILFVGVTPEVTELIQLMQRQPGKGYKPLAVITSDDTVKTADLHGVDVYHHLRTIRPAITNHKIQTVVIAPHLKENKDVLRELYELLFWPVQIVDLMSLYELLTGRIPETTFSESWFLDHLRNAERPLYDRLRIAVDVVSGILLSLVFLLMLLPIGILIKATSKGPIFFTQKRVGKYGAQFNIYKFRSMYALSPDGSAETQGAEFAKKKDKRVTPIGKLLRKTRLDELPQAINMLKGDISLVGPRPERPEIVNKLTARMPYYPLRHIIRPGLTSWAVLHQNYTDNLETSLQKLQYDLYYIKNRSLLLDLSILLRTVNLVIRFKGQ